MRLSTKQAAALYGVGVQTAVTWARRATAYDLAGVSVTRDGTGRVLKYEFDGEALETWVARRKAAGRWGRTRRASIVAMIKREQAGPAAPKRRRGRPKRTAV